MFSVWGGRERDDVAGSIPSTVSTHQSNLNSYLTTTNGHLTTLLSLTNAIRADKDAITSADRSIAEKTASLVKLQAPPDALDVQSQQLAIQQKEGALADAKAARADYYIRVPFDGVIAVVNVKRGDSVSSGAALATLITEQKIAEVSLNEVDVAQVKVGQRATLTFDAVPELSISGEVAEIDSLGTVSRGVVFGVSVAIGIIFGYYPARRASKPNPIEALRYE